jgi:Arylsulfotransferase (ASST)
MFFEIGRGIRKIRGGTHSGGNEMQKLAPIFLIAARLGCAEISYTTASVRPDNALIIDIQVFATGKAAKVSASYQTDGVDPLVTPFVPIPLTGPATITVGRLRAGKTYSYTVRAVDEHGSPAGTSQGSFTTGALPPALAANTYKLQGRTTVPLVILPHIETNFKGYVALDLHSSDAPQIVWYYSNAPSSVSGAMQVDPINSIVQDRRGNFLIADAGSGPPPLAADTFYREIAPDGTILSESPVHCAITPQPAGSTAPKGWIWAYGNDSLEQLVPGSDRVRGTVLHLTKIVKDPFFDAGLAAQGARLQTGIGIRRWTPATGEDDLVWDPFNFLDPIMERTDAATSDPGSYSGTRSPVPCSGVSVMSEEWMHSNSLQVTPDGLFLMSVRHLDTIIAISPQFDRIAWRIGRFGSDFSFPTPADKFYHEHFVRMLDNGNLLMLDNGNGRPSAEGGQYTRALELELGWESMTATKVWEYRHPVGNDAPSAYKYADKVGTAQRLDNGNTIVLFGADIDPVTLAAKNPQTFTLVEADSKPEANAVAVLDFLMPGANPVYRALPVETLFGEVTGRARP